MSDVDNVSIQMSRCWRVLFESIYVTPEWYSMSFSLILCSVFESSITLIDSSSMFDVNHLRVPCSSLIRLIFENEHWLFLFVAVSLTFTRISPLIVVIVIIPMRSLWFFDGHTNMHRLNFCFCNVMRVMLHRNMNPYSE